MKTWNPVGVAALLNTAIAGFGLPRENVRQGDVRGDYCGVEFFIDNGEVNAWISVCPFRTDGVSIFDEATPEIEFVEITESTADCRGGPQSRDPEVRRIYHAVEDALVEAGFDVVPSMGVYF